MNTNRIYFVTSVFLLVLTLGPITNNRTNAGETETDKTHIYAMRYGQSRFKLKDIYLSDKSDKTIDFTWLFYLITVQERIILIDTGFHDNRKVTTFNIQNYIYPADLLLELGIKPKDITDVIITHKHFDHSGLAYLYRNADIYIQKEDYLSMLQMRYNSQSAKVTDFLKSSKSLHLLTGDYSITPSITIKSSGGHTRGSQIVSVESKERPIIFTGDECYFIEGCEKAKINNLTENRYNNQQVLQYLKTAAQDESAILLTFHDPLICRRYPQIHENIFQVR